ncbi:ATP synthase F1 subunit delta [Membranihabitans maritimus]|uniref:ATP synthase F1 subunit delta n=1 Tax=Membranihabitans maritimus TaxID=2904244 RepID=UPI001F02A0F3|nr:ATP synthase F1 subunit delta [Membranihabitans maritimus]
MSSVRVAERYAKSLLDLAVSSGKIDEVNSDIKLFNKSLESKDLMNLLKSPIIKESVKVGVLNKIFSEKMQPLTMKFIQVVTRKGREDVLPEIASAFFSLYNDFKGITKVILTSAIPLDKTTVQGIEEKLINSGKTKKNIVMDTREDPSLIGGFILEFDNMQYDASVKGKFQRLRQKLTY